MAGLAHLGAKTLNPAKEIAMMWLNGLLANDKTPSSFIRLWVQD